MPIKIADALPARAILEDENIFVITESRALNQDIRPLKLLLLNLMPTKIVTETQILRKLSNTPLQIDVELLQTVSYTPKNTDQAHLQNFYRSFSQVKENNYDGMIITGAPVENLDFERVDYWRELCAIMDWTRVHVHSTLHICWGAQAALYHHHGVTKHALPKKLSGLFEHRLVKQKSSWFRGFDDSFLMPHSRYTGIMEQDVLSVPELELMSVSDKAGVFAVKTSDNRQFFITGHPEYDADTLALEYFRDQKKGLNTALPENYFPNDDPTQKPIISWRAHAQLLYTNWLNYYVYQTTPYDLTRIGQEK